MKIAIASMDGKTISSHFGKSPYFLIYEIAGNVIKGQSRIDNTFTHHFRKNKESGNAHSEHGHHDHSMLVEGLKDCQVVIAGGMGEGAYQDLTTHGFEVFIADEPDPSTAVNKYLSKELINHTERLH
jgi:predicted Fe-Mo cluster-binding NifX family protein